MRARRRSTPYLLIAPALLVFAGIVVVPIGLTAGYSFFRWDGLGPFEAVGLLNYRRASRTRSSGRRSPTPPSTSA